MTWRPVVGWEGLYEVTSDGRVRSVKRTVVRSDGTQQTFESVELTSFQKSTGYMVVRLSGQAPRQRRVASVHRLVAMAFLPNPDGKPEVNHIDGNKMNPRIENLEWVTPRENRAHAWRTGLRDRSDLPILRGEKSNGAKLTAAATA